MPILFKKSYPARNILFFLGEGLLIFSIVTGVQLLLHDFAALQAGPPDYIMRSALVTLVFQTSLHFFDLYDLAVLQSFSETAVLVTQAFGVGCIILAAFYYLFPSTIISTKVFWISYLAVCCGITVYRSSYLVALRKRLFTQPIILIGSGRLAEKIHDEIYNRLDSGYKIVTYLSNGGIKFSIPDGCTTSQSTEKLTEIARANKAERVVVALEDRRGTTPIKELIAYRLEGGIVTNGVGFYEELTGKIMVEEANPDWIIYSDGFKKGKAGSFLKRLTDLICSFLGLLISLPVVLLSALIIKVESPGPVFYFQERVGENNTPFNVIKFRSMRQDAEKNGAVWAVVNDDRVTRFGSFIRKVRIDEIPQMWNILVGDMSFVGPRPERPVFVKQLEKNIPYYSIRHTVRPGLTGWAQICYPYGASEEDALRKLEYDLYYLKNMSLALDLWIIFQTIKTVLFKKGAR